MLFTCTFPGNWFGALCGCRWVRACDSLAATVVLIVPTIFSSAASYCLCFNSVSTLAANASRSRSVNALVRHWLIGFDPKTTRNSCRSRRRRPLLLGPHAVRRPMFKEPVLFGLSLRRVKAAAHILRDRRESLDDNLDLVIAIQPLHFLHRTVDGGL